MAAIPIVKFDSGFSSVTRGSLFDAPFEFFSLAQMAFYSATKPGWSRCPLGYSTYSAMDAMGCKLVVPGIICPDVPAPNRKFPNYPLRFSRESIQNFLEPHLGISVEIRSQRDREFKNLTHDLRAISTEIYHTALTAKGEAERVGKPDIANSIESVMAAQQMMSLRLDIVDYESGHSAGQPKENIPVFKKIDKVLRCFQNKMVYRKIRYDIEGTSFSNVLGPPIFEIVPFVIIENAIKYAPYGSNFNVRFEEKDEEVVVRFESFGPKIKEAEKNRIFEQNFRGDAAKQSERAGSGIGLYAAKTLVEGQFSGKIFVNQTEEQMWCDGEIFYMTRFTIVLPVTKEYANRGISGNRVRPVRYS